MAKNLGCTNCPLKGKECNTCIITYRGSACEALRDKAGLKSDPKTNAEFLLEKFSADLYKMAVYLCHEGWHMADVAECKKWLLQPVDEDIVQFFAGREKTRMDEPVSTPVQPKWKEGVSDA